MTPPKNAALEAESIPLNKDRVRFLVRSLARRHKYLLSPAFEDVLVSLILTETAATRQRLAYLVDLFSQHVADPDEAKIQNLAFVLLAHHVDAEGLAVMPEDLDKNLGIE